MLVTIIECICLRIGGSEKTSLAYQLAAACQLVLRFKPCQYMRTGIVPSDLVCGTSASVYFYRCLGFESRLGHFITLLVVLLTLLNFEILFLGSLYYLLSVYYWKIMFSNVQKMVISYCKEMCIIHIKIKK